MAVINFREVLPRTASHKFGDAPTAEIRYVATVDAPTPTQTVVNTVGIFHGSVHPEFAFLKCIDISVTEPDRHHVELSYKYEVTKQGDQDPNPLARPDVWTFSTGGSQIPALSYYHGNGNSDVRPLQNTANEFVEGLTTLEAEVRATIAGNRLIFPLDVAAQATSCVNSVEYLGGRPHTWQCAGIGGQQAIEVVDGVELRYWQVTVELVYRRSGWNLFIPNVGWNYLEDHALKRAWVWWEPDNGMPREKIASSSPRALNARGGLKPEGEAPDILGDGAGLRVYPAIDFNGLFGTPSF